MFIEKFSKFLIVLTAFQLVSCSFDPPVKKVYPLRKLRTERRFEGKRYRPKFNALSAAWIYPFNEQKDFYELHYDQNKTLIGFTLRKEFDIKVEKKFKTKKKKKYFRTEHITRSFRANYPERARQDINFEITDNYNKGLKNRFTSRYYLFPRNFIPAIEVDEDNTRITLTNGEYVFMKTHNKEIISGPFKVMGPPSLNDFPKIEYKGRSIALRVDLENDRVDPRQDVTITHPNGDICFKPLNRLFNYELRLIFKFATDDEFYEYLEDECDFLPQGL